MAWEQQSPIHLEPTFSADLPSGYLSLHWSAAGGGFVIEHEHGTEVRFELSPQTFLRLGGKKFHLRQFHFHHPSEHFWAEQEFDGELHLVHQSLSDSTLAVVGIFLQVDDPAADVAACERWRQEIHRSRLAAERIPLEPLAWLPSDRRRVLRYEGSLTTPPYTEAVSWIVFPEPSRITRCLFAEIFGDQPPSARPIQPLNRRYVVELSGDIPGAETGPPQDNSPAGGAGRERRSRRPS